MDIGSVDLNLLKAFDALYAERHVTRAGLRIGLSQSAMSGALTRLRDLSHYCYRLFPVPSPIGGALILSANAIFYFLWGINPKLRI